MNILEEIAQKRKADIEQRKQRVSLEKIKEEAERKAENEKKAGTFGYRFLDALKKDGIGFICEVKKASPSKGLIAEKFPYVEIAKEYEKAGASAISVLTEPEYFLGKDEYLKEIKKNVSIPLLRKDFTIDEYQIYEAKVIGADAVLLICALLDDETLRRFYQIAKQLGLSALIETHDEEEVRRALELRPDIIGVNNRNLKTFTVDIHNSTRLRALVPKEVVFVSESGIKTAEDVKTLRENHTDAVLIGETLMRSVDKKQVLDELRG